MADFKNLLVWRKAHALSLNVHRTTSSIRGLGAVSLRSQMVRAAMSVAANIVEGSARKSDADFARFVKIALASTTELEYHLIVGRDSRLLTKSDFHSLSAQTIEVRRMLYGLLRRLELAVAAPEKSTSSKLPAVS